MSKAIPVALPSIQFPTKTEAKKFFKDMLNRYKDGQDIDQDDHELLYELLLLHPHTDDKIGNGIKKFYRDQSPDHPTSCFHIERESGPPTDFSYIECISSTKLTIEQYFYRACRQSVSEILTAEKNSLFDQGNVRCCKTNELVTKKNSEYRHTSPAFWEIIRDFKKILKRPIDKNMFYEDTYLQYSTRFSDKEIESQFIKFHQSIANLDIFKKYKR